MFVCFCLNSLTFKLRNSVDPDEMPHYVFLLFAKLYPFSRFQYTVG